MDRCEIIEFSGSDRAWEARLAALEPDAALQNRFAYGAIAAAGGRAVRRCVLSRAGQDLALAQLIGRRGLWLLARGPVFAPDLADGTRRALLRRLARSVRGLLVATPEAPLAGVGLVPLITPRHHAIWDIAGPSEALRAGLSGKWRNALVRAERAEITVRRERDPSWLIAREAAQRQARGYRALPGDFALAWDRACPGAMLALTVRDRAGTGVAGVIFLRHGTGASYHLGWTGPEGRQMQAHNLLLWEAAARLRAAGVERLDLGEVNSEAGAALMRFKLGTGARLRPLAASSLVVPG